MPSFRTSGDAIADRRFAYAMDYKAAGDLAAAAELVEQALERAPCWAAGWFALGDLREAVGARSEAEDAYRRSLGLDADDTAGACARLARLGALPADGAMTTSHVAALFDEYAPRFERSLVGDLAYRGPALLKAALSGLRQPFSFGATLDLGCGTGLAAEAFQDFCQAIAGVDLSEAMLALALAKQIYGRLEQDDVLSFLSKQPAASADLILAADVFVYLGDLCPIFREAARVLQPGGLFAFTAQRQEDEAPFILNHDMRYAHSHAGIAAWAGEAELRPAYADNAWARLDRGAPAPGMVVVLERQARRAPWQ
jgi:predicted TPR repeat methyltransferase